MTRWLVVHPSDEMYGADRILLAAVDLLDGPVTVWLPDDVDYPERPLSQALAERGVPVEVRPLPVARRARLTAGQLPTLARELAAASAGLRRLRPDRVLLNTSATLPLAPSARATGARVLLHLHEIWGRTDRLLLSAPARAADRIIAVSQASRGSLPAGLRRRAVTVRNGVPAAPVLPAGERDALRRRAGCRPDAMVLLVASRWNGWKGHDVLLDAWSRLRRQDLHLVVLGGPPPSGASIDVPGLVRRLPREAPPVTVIGPVDDTAGWLAAADLLVVPSARPDPLPTIALEALAAGRGVVASAIGGLPEIVSGDCGRLVPAADPLALAACLDALDAADARGWGLAAGHRWRERFGVERFRAELGAALHG